MFHIQEYVWYQLSAIWFCWFMTGLSLNALKLRCWTEDPGSVRFPSDLGSRCCSRNGFRSQFMDGNPSYKRATSIRNKGIWRCMNITLNTTGLWMNHHLPTSWPYLFVFFVYFLVGVPGTFPPKSAADEFSLKHFIYIYIILFAQHLR